MSLISTAPQPSLAWQFENSNVDYVTGLSPTFSTTAGTLTSAPTYTTGKYNQAISLTNTLQGTSGAANCYVVFTNLPSISVDNGVTLLCWVNPVNFTGAVPHYAVGLGDSLSNVLYMSLTTTTLGTQNSFSTSSLLKTNTVSATISPGTWYHVAFTYNSTQTIAYLNGTASTPVSTSSTGINFTSLKLGTMTNGINTGAGFNPFDGLIDDLRIFNTTLSATQVQAIYNQQGMPGRAPMTITSGLLDNTSVSAAAAFGLRLLRTAYTGPAIQIQRQSDLTSNDFVADYAGNLSNVLNGTMLQGFLSGTTGNVVKWYDQSGNGRTATRNGTTPGGVIIQTANLACKWAISFSGGSGAQRLNLINDAFLNSSDFTVCSTSRRVTSNPVINSSIWGYGANSAWTIDTSLYGYNTRFEMQYNTGTSMYFMQYAQTVAPTIFTIPAYNAATEPVDSFAFVSAGSTASSSFYRNGTLTATSTYPQVTANISGPFTIGGTGAYGGLQGEMGELIIFNSALSSAQVSQIYKSQVNNTSGTAVQGSGTPLFSQLSAAATASAVGAFSLRAVNGVSARAVQVRPVAAFPPAAMTGATTSLTGYPFGGTGSYVASSSSIASGTFVAWQAFDKSNALDRNEWASSSVYSGTTYGGSTTTTVSSTSYPGEWLQIQFPSSVLPTSITITSPWNAGGPRTFVFAGSVNGSTWDLLINQTTATNLNTNNTSQSFPISTTNTYNYFRLIVTTAYTIYAQVGELVVFGSPSGSSTDFYADRLGNLLTAPVVGQSLADWLGSSVGNVVTWYDQSGQGNHATQATAANQPGIQKATKGPGYSVLFGGSSSAHLLTLPASSYSLLNGLPGYNVTIAERRNAVTTGQSFFGVGNASAQGSALITGWIADTQMVFSQRGVNVTATVPNYAGSSEPMHYWTFERTQNASLNIYQFAALAAFGTQTITISAPSGNPVTIGKSFGTTSYPNYYTGEMYEILVFTKSLYDLDNTGGLITQIYQNQLSYTGT